MKRKRSLIFMLAAVLLVMSGCSLAVEDAGGADGHDRLIGAFITKEYLDLFDMERYFNENADKLLRGGEISARDTAAYQGRLYAVMDEEGEISFPGVEGAMLLCPKLEDSGVEHYANISSGVSDVKLSVNATDYGDEQTLEGTVYANAGTFYANPVYQSPDGSIYAVSGNGYIMQSNWDAEGEVCAATLSETYTETWNGQTSSLTNSVTVHFAVKFPPKLITLYQMDEDNRILRANVYNPGSLPETFTAEENAAYILVQTEKRMPDGSTIIQREIFDDRSEDAALETYYAQPDGTLTTRQTEITWN